MNKRTKIQLMRRLNRFERAVRAHEFMGATPPEEWGAIEAEYKAAKLNLLYFLHAPPTH